VSLAGSALSDKQLVKHASILRNLKDAAILAYEPGEPRGALCCITCYLGM